MGQVTTTYKGDMLFESQLGDHTVTIDGPETWGGKGRGPEPPQLFMSSIGSCVAVLVTHFCNEHDMDASGLKVSVEYDAGVHPTRFQNIKVKINAPNAICDDICMRETLEHIVKHCPVYESIVTLERVNFELTTG